MPTWKIIQGDCLEAMKTMPDCSVQCVVTSPPYWSLRDYQIEGQYGLEETPEAHVAKMVEVFREVRRILRDDGTLWLNYGDSYAGSTGMSGGEGLNTVTKEAGVTDKPMRSAKIDGLKPKDLCGIPWRVALALQADGWWLRQDIIWHKPNPMPESVTDRCTKSHEYLFLLAKSQHYYFDADAIREDAPTPYHGDVGYQCGNKDNSRRPDCTSGEQKHSGRNRRSVWTIATEPSKDMHFMREEDGKYVVDKVAHFATFPRKLVEPCIRAGTSEKGCCPKCGMPWERIIEEQEIRGSWHDHSNDEITGQSKAKPQKDYVPPKSLGWQPSCDCGLEPVPCTVFDLFSGSGTVGLVALPLGRNYIGIELNPDYVAMSRRRLLNETGLIAKEST